MGYIKKLKNNELVGGTDKTTIYPVTSAEAVFEEVIEDGESNFKSQKFLNNNITGDRINEGTITDYNIAVGTVTKGKLSSQVQTMLDEGQKKALTPKGDYNAETVYEALDLVFDRDSNSSYVSLITPNTEPLTNEDAWEMFLDGTAVNTAQATINDKVDELVEQVDDAIEQARQDIIDATNAANNAAQYATQTTDDKVAWVEDQVDNLTAYEVSPSLNTTSIVPTQTKVVAGALGYFTCETPSGTALKEVVNPYGYALPTNGGAMKIKMINANTVANATLKIGTETAKPLFYNGERANATNSWDANEVISVYYDGTNYQASNAQGGSNKKINAYLYDDVRTLAVGQVYEENEAVKTIDKQLLRMIVRIGILNLSDTVTVGDLKVYNGSTYQAQNTVSIYSGNDTDYEIGSYAVIDNVVKVFDGSSWSTAAIGTYVNDVWSNDGINEAWLIENAATQNTLLNDLTGKVELNINAISRINCFIHYSSNQWLWQNNYTTSGGNWGKFLAIEGGKKYMLVGGSSNTNYAFLTNNTHTTGAVTNFAVGTLGYSLSKNAIVVATAPQDAKYLYVNVTLNGGNIAPKAIYKINTIEEINEVQTNISNYLYNDVKILTVGTSYKVNDSVKTSDKQFRRITKEIEALSLSETLASGDIKISGNSTYRVANAITTFNPSTEYTAGAYALGNMTVYTLTVTAESVTAGNITVNGTEVAIEDNDDATSIASKIAGALVIDGWSDSASENVVTVRCNTIGNNTTTITITDIDNTGVAVASSSVAGTSVIRKYDGETWTNASVSGMVTDGKLVEVDVAWLIANATKQNSVTQDIEAATTYWEDINIASIANSYVGMYNSGGWKWQNKQDNNYGKFVSIEPGRRYKMVGGTSETNYALLKNNTHATGNITNFATGETGRILNSNATVIITPPADAKYLYFRTNSKGGLNRTPQSLSVFYDFHDLRENYNERFETIDENIETLDEAIKDNGEAIKNINDFPDIVLTGEESVDIASLEEQNCSLGGSGTWYYNGSSAGKHKAIELEPDSIVGIKVSGYNYGFYGWVTSSYTPPTNNATIPYAIGTGRKQLSRKDAYTYLKAPAGAKYLIVCTVDGGGTRVSWEVVNCEYNYRNNSFVKFRVAHWNIGHFAGYDGVHAGFNPTITPENAEVMARKYKQLFNDLGADILGISEYDPNFTTDGQKSKDIVFQCYKKILEGTKQEYPCNTIMFNGFKYINSGEIQYSTRQQREYIKYANIEINGRAVCVVQTHWDFNTPELKRSQGTQLLNLVKDCKYAIVSGDLNTYDVRGTESHRESDIATLKMFRDAGFEFANNGYLAPFTTSVDGGSIDHIMVKGFSMSNRHTVEVSGTLSDHYLLYCDLVMNP